MLKSIMTLAAGAIAGAAAALYLLGQQGAFSLESEDSPSLLESVAGLALGRDRARTEPAITVSEQLAAYSAAQGRTDVADIERSLAAAARREPSVERDLEIDALLVRLSDLAPARAAAVASELPLEPGLVIDAWALWAERDADAALAGLASVTQPALRRELALALLDIAGNDAAAADRVAARLPATERNAFLLDRLGLLAEDAPQLAVREAELLPDLNTKRAAMQAIGTTWARRDPVAALNQSELLRDSDMARQFRAGVYSEWARSDPGALADYLESGVPFQDEMFSGVQILMAGDPERAMRIAEGFGGTMGPQIAAMALGAIAESDPAGAMARAEGMPPGQVRDYAVQTVASTLARSDPDRAIEWAQGLSPPSQSALRNVYLTIATSNPERAMEMLDANVLGSEASLMFSMLASQLTRDPEQAARFADQLAARDDIQSAAALRSLMSNWMSRDPESALDWVLASDARIDAAVLGSAAQTMASRDPQAAVAVLERIPPRYRDVWITQLAGPYGRYDPQGAWNWISQFRGQPAYLTASREVINNAAQTDPRAAAGMLAQASPEVQFASAPTIASRWAQQDPREAVLWASGLSDERARTAATTNAINAWAVADRPAARRWTLEQRAGPTRDQALQMLLQRGASAGEFDEPLLDAFSNQGTRRGAIQSSLTVLARSNPQRARDLLASDLVDANLRRQIEQQIEQIEQLNQSAQGQILIL